VDAALAIVLAFMGGGACASDAPAALAALVFSTVALRATRRVSLRVAFAIVIAFGTGGARSIVAVDEARAAWLEAETALRPPRTCSLVFTVSASPVVRGGAPSASARIDASACAGTTLPPSMTVRLRGVPRDAARGDRFVGVAELAATQLFRNEGGGTTWARVARSDVVASGTLVAVAAADRGAGPGALVDRARAAVRERIDATYHPRAAPLGRALVLGENDLDESDDEAFRKSGLSHLLAVSGTHLSVSALALAAALRALFLRIDHVATRVDPERPASVVAFFAAVAYADFAGGSGSVLRAVCMLGALLFARAAGRRPDGVRAFAASLALGTLVDPMALLDLSFALSAAATAGLLFLAPWFVAVARAAPDGPLPALVATLVRALATTSAATIACAPLLASTARELPALGLLANLIAAPIGELAALPICLLHAASSGAPALERGAAEVGSGALLAVLAIARAATGLGGALAVPSPSAVQCASLASGVTLLTALAGTRERLACGALLAASLVALEAVADRTGAPRGVLRVTALDVAQGDALLIDLPDGSAMLVDGGGLPGGGLDIGRRVLAPALAARRRERIDVVVLTHPHADHAGGLPTALRDVEVGELWDTGEGEAKGAGGAVKELLRALRERDVPVRRPADLCGAPRDFGGATVRVLAPCPSFDEAKGANDNSFVIQITYGSRSVLLTGDAEAEAEEDLVHREGDGLRSDLLKVGHHGSRSSSTAAFLERVRPVVSFTSCGARNGFGHPHAESVARRAGILDVRTDLSGELRFTTDGDRAWLSFPGW
jgi:competence protein ComEC